MSQPHPTSCHCPSCGTVLSGQCAAGLCPRCLLAGALSESGGDLIGDPELVETIDSGSNRPDKGKSSVSELNATQKSFDDYDLIDEIARGGMGVVYKARHKKLGRNVALKVILSGQFASANDVRRFQMEAESAASLDHPGIVPIYEIGEHEGHHFFTMKLIEGGSLAEHMRELKEDQRRFVGLLAQVAEAINYAHRRGILHRDIKPANILLDADGHPLVTDLGLAKRTESDSDLTGTGAIVGTPAYMPPEQASASKEVTTAADVYSLGAILYEGLTGRPPHQGDSPVAVLMQAAKGSVEPPNSVDRKVDQVLELISMKCLAFDPNERYPSAGALAKDLTCWLTGEQVSVRPKSFASAFSELVTDQLRSAIGAVLIGLVAGILTGVPVYSGIALRWFGSKNARFNIVELKRELPQLSLGETWWLTPPSWTTNIGFLVSTAVAVFLGLIIHWIVRPKDTRQAIAIGLVTGLLMTLVQFGLYGIAAGWQTFALSNANQIELLAEAGFSPESERQLAIEKLNAAFPDLANVEAKNRAALLGKAVSIRIMLASPVVFLGILCVCLAFSTIYCVGGTVHANRLTAAGFGWWSTLARYLEVMVLLTYVMLSIVFIVFFTCGMMTDANGPRSLPLQLLLILGMLIVATIPGWKMMRWYYRWPVYIVCVGLAISLL